MEDCKHAYQLHHGDFLEGINVDRVDFLICSMPFGGVRNPANPTMSQGCAHIKDVCENMKKCYMRFRDYFTFSGDFEHYMERTGIVTIVFTSFALTLNVLEHFDTMKVKRFLSEQLAELSMISLLIFGSAVLMAYHYMSMKLHQDNSAYILDFFLISGLRWSWEVLLYLLTLSFRLYIVSFATRTHFTMALVTNVCKLKTIPIKLLCQKCSDT